VSTYFTDSWSTISGLASVAYGSPDRYPEVANQVRRKSPASFLENVLPSDVIKEGLSEADLATVLQAEYDKDGKFADFVDSQSLSVQELAKKFFPLIVKGFDENSSYQWSLTSVFDYVMGETGIDPQAVKNALLSLKSDLETYSSMAVNVPSNKLDKVPPGTLISLKESVSLSEDQNGINITTGYLIPSDYYNEVAYPGSQSNLLDSVIEGYKTYPTLSLLDNVFTPDLNQVVNTDDLSSLNNVSRSIAGLGTLDTIKDLTGIGSMSDADRAMYEVDLTSIVIDLNGYTIYDPLTDSNGDFIDTNLIPDYNSQNSDPGSGQTYSARERSIAFES
jgi:hypothetical protein